MLRILFSVVMSGVMFTALAQSYPSFEKKELIMGNDTLRYRIQYPIGYNPGGSDVRPSDNKPSAHSTYPLVLLLHGSGERGRDNEAQLVWGGSLFADSAVRVRFPAIVIFPQCPGEDAWCRLTYDRQDSIHFHMRSDTTPTVALGLVIHLLDNMVAEGVVDTKRIYVGGLSMGGMGTYEVLWRKPRFFAAAFPICGAGDPRQVNLYARNFPIWVFHGDKDPAVPVANSRLLVGVLKTDHADVKYTEYPGVGHDSWKNAFAEPELLPWLFRQKRR